MKRKLYKKKCRLKDLLNEKTNEELLNIKQNIFDAMKESFQLESIDEVDVLNYPPDETTLLLYFDKPERDPNSIVVGYHVSVHVKGLGYKLGPSYIRSDFRNSNFVDDASGPFARQTAKKLFLPWAKTEWVFDTVNPLSYNLMSHVIREDFLGSEIADDEKAYGKLCELYPNVYPREYYERHDAPEKNVVAQPQKTRWTNKNTNVYRKWDTPSKALQNYQNQNPTPETHSLYHMYPFSYKNALSITFFGIRHQFKKPFKFFEKQKKLPRQTLPPYDPNNLLFK